jgi:hypothetical protein
MYKAIISNEPHYRRPKGTWKELETENAITASFACPGCGVVGTLEEHVIHPDGRVEPSVDCPEGCGFHDTVVLDNWIGKNGHNKAMKGISNE